MADLDRIADDLKTKAALAAGREAAKGAVRELLSADEERTAEDVEPARASNSRRNKLIAYGVVALLLVLGVIGLVLRFWYVLLLAGLVGALGLYAWRRLRRRIAARKGDTAPRLEEPESARSAGDRAGAGRLARLASVEDARDRGARRRDEPAAAARAQQEERAIAEREIDDELAALKARIDR